ncbi:MAG TPA: malonyl-CoA decarboxylase [Burkholderiaceae bacterium]|nr:malonyl-CoA decarboxylase [Burkholderiaceae bacterium]
MLDVIRSLRRDPVERDDVWWLSQACAQLLTERGESNSRAIAAAAIDRWKGLDADGVHRFFRLLAADFDPDPGTVLRLAEDYAVTRSPDNLVRLAKAAEPPRQELLRRLNRAEGGTTCIVQMRARLIERLRQDRALKAVDADFEHLLSSWFNPGFLRLVRVDWSSPAALLERIIQHEAVHEIDGWSDLRRRLEPDRRCFAFFHPVLPDEPLIFVEVALLPQMPSAIAPLIDRAAPVGDPDAFRVAAFYSISNCQPGLRGINLGNFLIKQVAERLQRELPRLKTFCTLSPIPGFAGWLAKVDPESLGAPRMRAASRRALQDALEGLRARHGADLAGLLPAGASSGVGRGAPEPRAPADESRDRDALAALCAHFLVHRTAAEGPEADPVGRFHLNNGARLQRINPSADLSRKGLRQSFGLMVNYLYDLDDIESNHEKFVRGEVAASRAVTSLI